MTESPHDQGTERREGHDRRQHAHRERNELGQPRLEALLDRPHHGDDQQGECERREDGAGEIERGDHDYGGADADRCMQPAAAGHVGACDGFAHGRVAVRAPGKDIRM
jgi:hypothetical protein